jgi:hypothetical protein
MTTAEEAADIFANEIKGKNGAALIPDRLHEPERDAVLITGTSIGGLGFETARVIAKHASLVVITGHNVERFVPL